MSTDLHPQNCPSKGLVAGVPGGAPSGGSPSSGSPSGGAKLEKEMNV